jgi:hypothetical protein
MEIAQARSRLGSLPRISPADIDELARNPLVVRLMAFWDVLTEGMNETAKRALLWEAFLTVRAAFDVQQRAKKIFS